MCSSLSYVAGVVCANWERPEVALPGGSSHRVIGCTFYQLYHCAVVTALHSEGSKIQGHPLLHSKVNAKLNYKGTCHNQSVSKKDRSDSCPSKIMLSKVPWLSTIVVCHVHVALWRSLHGGDWRPSYWIVSVEAEFVAVDLEMTAALAK